MISEGQITWDTEDIELIEGYFALVIMNFSPTFIFSKISKYIKWLFRESGDVNPSLKEMSLVQIEPMYSVD